MHVFNWNIFQIVITLWLQKFIYGGISIFEDEATIFDVNDMTNSAIEVELDSIGQFTGLEDKKEFCI